MKSIRMIAVSLFALLAFVAAAPADTKVELKGVHLCCPLCVKSVAGILKGIDGVQGKCDQNAGTVTITAPDDKTAQKALDALAAGGFHGDTGNADLKIKEDSGVKAGKVKTLTLTGVHNCCNNCTKGINAALKNVEGVSGNSAKAKSDTFEVKGDFDAAEVVKALNAAGYHVKVKE